MRFAPAIAAVSALVLLAGCTSATLGLHGADSSALRGPVPAQGSAYNSASIYAEARPNAYFGLLFLGYLAVGAQDGYSSPDYGASGRRPPQLAEGRAIAERDCSQPLEIPSANLRCR